MKPCLFVFLILCFVFTSAFRENDASVSKKKSAPHPAVRPVVSAVPGMPTQFVFSEPIEKPKPAPERFQPQGSMGRKFERGLTNLLLGPFEIAYRVRQPDSGQFMPPWVIGIGKGIGYAVRRMAVGAYEIVTFPIPYPNDYLPIIEPEFVWEYPPRKKPHTPPLAA